MQLSDAQTELAARGFDAVSPARMVTILNQAKNQFEDIYPFPWLESTASGLAPKTIADLKDVLYVVDTTNQRELVGTTAQFVVGDLDPTIGNAGAPVVWWLDGANIVTTYPLSTSAQLLVRYVKESPELAAPTDTPLIPVRYHNTWIDLAVIRGYLDRDDLGAAGQLRQVVSQDLAAVVSRYATMNRQNGAYQQIRGYSEDW